MAQRGTAQHGTAWYGAARHSVARRSTAPRGMALRSAAQHSTAQHSTAQHSTAQHSTAQHSTAQHSTAQHSTVVPADRYLEATKDRILSIRALMGPASECHSALDSSTLPKASNSTNRPAHVHAQLRQCPCCCTKQAAVHHVPNCSRRVPNCGKTC